MTQEYLPTFRRPAILIDMKVLIFEDNLLWSSKLKKSVEFLGHEAEVIDKFSEDFPDGDRAIVNLGSEKLSPEKLLPLLKSRGIWTIGHAGHKEKTLHEKGISVGCDQVVTNSAITFKLEEILNQTMGHDAHIDDE